MVFSDDNIVPFGLSNTQVTAFEACTPEWLDDNYYHLDTIIPAVCCRLVNRRINPHNHVSELEQLKTELAQLGKCQTLRVMVGGRTVIVYHMDGKRGPKFELVMY